MDVSRSTTLTLVSSLAVSAALIGAAFFTVQRAGCDDPGRLVARADGVVQLVGGCVAPGDLVVPGALVSPAPASTVVPGPGLRP